jgi:hypothetical protein
VQQPPPVAGDRLPVASNPCFAVWVDWLDVAPPKKSQAFPVITSDPDQKLSYQCDGAARPHRRVG